MINDPGAWGGGTEPEYVVLGFSKGATQAGIYETGQFEHVAFAGMRPRLTKALRAVGVLADEETADGKIEDPDSTIAFGSLIRCSVSRLDKAASANAGKEVYACTGALIGKSFKEIPSVIDTCANQFLKDFPASVRVVVFLGNTDSYVRNCQALLRRLFPADFKQINPMAVSADGHLWVHIAHPSGLNGHFNCWLNTNHGPGLKRLHAKAAVTMAQQRHRDSAFRGHGSYANSTVKNTNQADAIRRRPLTDDLFLRSFCLIHKSGVRLYPVRLKNCDTGQVAYRLSPGGTGGNTKELGTEETDESVVIQRVLDGWAVRAASLDRKIAGLYKVNHRSISGFEDLR